ncbi:MAG: GyrI-like domain-containing protein [Proteobacteria bacterium]|nr:GyrI-like domain-containing protein [Pseudomonadota bacterium]
MPVVQIVDLAQTPVAAVEHRGASADVYESTRKLIEWRRLHRVAANSHRTFCVVHDIRAEAARDYRVDVCVEFAREVRANAQGVISKGHPRRPLCARALRGASRVHPCAASAVRRMASREWGAPTGVPSDPPFRERGGRYPGSRNDH